MDEIQEMQEVLDSPKSEVQLEVVESDVIEVVDSDVKRKVVDLPALEKKLEVLDLNKDVPLIPADPVVGITENSIDVMERMNIDQQNAKHKTSDTRTPIPHSSATPVRRSIGYQDKITLRNGRIAADPIFEEKKPKSYIYVDEEDVVWEARLILADVIDNMNKYIFLQLLKYNVVDKKGKKFDKYCVWFRSGRIGYVRVEKTIVDCANLEEAKEEFCIKFSNETKNKWENRSAFQRQPNSYSIVEVDYSHYQNVQLMELEDNPKDPSDLEAPIAKFMDLISIKNALTELGFELQLAPFGLLSTNQIAKGYILLDKISNHIQQKESIADGYSLMDEYYSTIPHDIGYNKNELPLITSDVDVENELTLLKKLINIKVTVSRLGTNTAVEDKRSGLDIMYEEMKCQLRCLDKKNDAEAYEKVSTYLHSQVPVTWQNRSKELKRTTFFDFEIINIFEITKEDKFCADLENRCFLWHGSQLPRWYGILKNGLQLNVPEAHKTGAMFDNGYYFADVANKAGSYSYPWTVQKPKTSEDGHKVGVILLSEVALGNSMVLRREMNDARAHLNGKDSVEAEGLFYRAVDSDQEEEDEENGQNEAFIPSGDFRRREYQDGEEKCENNFNEFVVFNVNQVRMSYVVQVAFK